MANREVDVIIVGAGISGLTAARTLHAKDANLKLLVLEGKDRVGGRTLTVELKTENGTDNWDMGGQWVGRCQTHIMELLEELGIETFSQYLKGEKFMQIGSNKVRSYKSDIPSLSPLGLIDTNRLMTKTDELSLEVDSSDPYSCEHAKQWDSMTLETFFDKHAMTSEAKELMQSALRCMMGAEMSQMSLLYFLTYVAAAGNLKNLVEGTPYTAQEYKIKGGAQQISEKMALSLGKDRVLLSTPVQSISEADDRVLVKTKTGAVFKCHKVILAVPPNQLSKLEFPHGLPTVKKELLKRMPSANLTKIIITYKTPFWRAAGKSGEVVTNGGASTMLGCDGGPLCIVYDATSHNGNAAIVGFIGASQAVQWRQKEYEARRSAVLKSLAEFFGDQIYDFIDYCEKDWDSESYTEGSPICTVGPGAMRYFADGLRKPFGRLHFAGTESATIWCGYMSGAVQAGRRAAIEVLYDLRPQLVSVQDLSEPKTIPKPAKKKSLVVSAIKWSVRIGIATVFVISARKLLIRFVGSFVS